MQKPIEQEKPFSAGHVPSCTAMWTSFCRAMARKEPHPEFRGPDDMAKIFVPPVKNFLLRFKFMRAYIQKKLTPGAYAYLIARTKHIDNIFSKALREKVPQIVLLGAGYDTRAIRFRDSIQKTQIFELDMSATQQHKINLLQKAKVMVPHQLIFVPIDFNKERLADALVNAGYDPTQKSLFIWEGVTMYLTEEAVKDTLNFIRLNSGEGSTLAFDYFFKSVVEGTSDDYGAREQYQAVIKLGEPFQFGIEKGKIESFLSENGFKILSHYNPDAFEKKYLYDGKGNRFGKMYSCPGNVYAGVIS